MKNKVSRIIIDTKLQITNYKKRSHWAAFFFVLYFVEVFAEP